MHIIGLCLLTNEMNENKTICGTCSDAKELNK